MSQKNFQIFRSQISDLKTDNVDYLKKPPWKKFFFDIFLIHLSSRYEKRCRMLQRLFSLFQGSKNQLWYDMLYAYLNQIWKKWTVRFSRRFCFCSLGLAFVYNILTRVLLLTLSDLIYSGFFYRDFFFVIMYSIPYPRVYFFFLVSRF